MIKIRRYFFFTSALLFFGVVVSCGKKEKENKSSSPQSPRLTQQTLNPKVSSDLSLSDERNSCKNKIEIVSEKEKEISYTQLDLGVFGSHVLDEVEIYASEIESSQKVNSYHILAKIKERLSGVVVEHTENCLMLPFTQLLNKSEIEVELKEEKDLSQRGAEGAIPPRSPKEAHFQVKPLNLNPAYEVSTSSGSVFKRLQLSWNFLNDVTNPIEFGFKEKDRELDDSKDLLFDASEKDEYFSDPEYQENRRLYLVEGGFEERGFLRIFEKINGKKIKQELVYRLKYKTQIK